MRTINLPVVALLIAVGLIGAHFLRRPPSPPPVAFEPEPQSPRSEANRQNSDEEVVDAESSDTWVDESARAAIPPTTEEAHDRLDNLRTQTRDRGGVPPTTWGEVSRTINALTTKPRDPSARPGRGPVDLPRDDGTIAALRKASLEATAPDERIESLKLLGSLPSDQPYTDVLLQALFDTDTAVRLAATEELAWLNEDAWNSPDAQNALERALGDPDPEIRREALHVIGEMDSGQVANSWPLVEAALDDPDEEVRALAESVFASAS